MDTLRILACGFGNARNLSRGDRTDRKPSRGAGHASIGRAVDMQGIPAGATGMLRIQAGALEMVGSLARAIEM